QASELVFRRRTTNTAAAPSSTAAPPARAIEVVGEEEPVAARLSFVPVVAGAPGVELCGVAWVLPVAGFAVGEGVASCVVPGLFPAALMSNWYMSAPGVPPQ